MNWLPNTIVTFHTVHESAELENKLTWLHERYRFASVEEIDAYYYNAHRLRNTCHITFDDGHESFYTKAYPVIMRWKIPVTIFVSPDAIITRKNLWFQEIEGYDEKTLLGIMLKLHGSLGSIKGQVHLKAIIKSMAIEKIWQGIREYQALMQVPEKQPVNMTVDQLKEVRDSKLVTIGAHTMRHPILKNECMNCAKYEIVESILQLGSLLNEDVRYFSYPNGQRSMDYGVREMEILSKTSVRLAFSTENALLKNTSPYEVPRAGFIMKPQILVIARALLGRRWGYAMRHLRGQDENAFRNKYAIQSSDVSSIH